MKLQFCGEIEANIYEGTAKKLENLAKHWIDTGFTTSVTYLAAHQGVIFAYGAKGKRNDKEKIKPDDIFPIASITKILTGIAFFMLTEEGLVGPTRPVCEFIPEFTGEGKDKVLVHHLLTHTSGINDDELWTFINNNSSNITVPEEYIKKDPDAERKFYISCKAPLWKMPGEEMSYSSFGINIIGEIIRRVSNKSLDEFFKERIFEPLGMKDSFLAVPDEITERIIQLPENALFKWFNTEKSRKSLSASGGAYSNAYDLAVLGQMLLNKGMYNGKRILSRASIEAMTRNQTKGIISKYDGKVFNESGWGLPFMLSLDKTDETGTLRSREAFSHTGAGCSLLFVDPVYEVVATCFAASIDSGDGKLNRKFDNYLNAVISGVL